MSGEGREDSDTDKGALSLVPQASTLVLLGTGLAMSGASWGLNAAYPEPPSTADVSLGWSGWTRLVLVMVAAILGGIALRIELRRNRGAGWPQFPESATAAIVCVVLAQILWFSANGLLGQSPVDQVVDNDNTGEIVTWTRPAQMESLARICRVGMICAFVGGFLLVIPEMARRVVLVGSITFHFCGILSAVLSVPPPGGNSPWLISQAWTFVYRPYLLFIYQNNAYHFYSPEPGPPSLLWLQITYTDGGKRWFRLPDVETSPTPMHFQRMLSIGESTAQVVQRDPGAYRSEAVLQKMAQLLGLERLPRGTIAPLTWREPMPNAKHYMCSYVRSLVSRFPHPDNNSDATVLESHLWRVVHTVIQPGNIAYDKSDPTDRRFYVTVYQGEYDEKGNLRDPNDPLLYWMIQAYDRDMLEQLVQQATERENEVRRLRDLRPRDQVSPAEMAVMAEEADALKRFQGMLQVWLRQKEPVIDFFKLQSDSNSFPPASVWVDATRPAGVGADKVPKNLAGAPGQVRDKGTEAKAGAGIHDAGEVRP
ncbi:MAG: hypothetical protein ACKOS8_18120 [Gemmataceae bacterium]